MGDAMFYKIKPYYFSDPKYKNCVTAFVLYMKDQFGVSMKEAKGGIFLIEDKSLSFEEYLITSSEDMVILKASTEKGMHNALADLLLRITIKNDSMIISDIFVKSAPDCSYRGLMIDLARQWHPLDYLLKYIDLCWKSRATHLQLHFTDSQSFTLPINSFPDLPTKNRSYSKEEINILVEYADSHGIILIPEVDVPGHSAKFFEKYPEVFGTNGVLPACDEVFDALRMIFSEVIEMFPNSPYIHIGGDEANIYAWEECEKTIKYMSKHGISNIHEMYAEYIRIVTEMIFDSGRTPIVWEGFSKEYNDKIDRRTIVIAWESYYQPAYDLAEAGFTLINCSWKPLYIVTPDTYWSKEEINALDPWRWEHWWEKSVAYPKGYSIDRNYPVLGEQLCAWGDKIADWENWEDGIIEEMRLVSERFPVMCGKLWNLNL